MEAIEFTQEEHESFIMAEELEYFFSGQSALVKMQDWWKDLQGMPLDEAEILAQSKGWVVRPVNVDDNPLEVTIDGQLNRLNVSVANGRVRVFPYRVG